MRDIDRLRAELREVEVHVRAGNLAGLDLAEGLLRAHLDTVTGPPNVGRPFFIHVEREARALLRLIQFEAILEEGDDDNYVERLKRAFDSLQRAARDAINKLDEIDDGRVDDSHLATGYPYIDTYFARAPSLRRQLLSIEARAKSSSVRDELRIMLDPPRARATLLTKGGLTPHAIGLTTGVATLIICAVVWWQFSSFPPLEMFAGPVFLLVPLIAVAVSLVARRMMDVRGVRKVRKRFSAAFVEDFQGVSGTAAHPDFSSERHVRPTSDDMKEFKLPTAMWKRSYGEQPDQEADLVAARMGPSLRRRLRWLEPYWRPVYANFLPFVASAFIPIGFLLASLWVLDTGSTGNGSSGALTACPAPEKKAPWSSWDFWFNPPRCLSTVVGLNSRGDECVMAEGTIRWSGGDNVYVRPREETNQRTGAMYVIPRHQIRRIEYAVATSLPKCSAGQAVERSAVPLMLPIFSEDVLGVLGSPKAAFEAGGKSAATEFRNGVYLGKLAKALAACSTAAAPARIDVLGFASDREFAADNSNHLNFALAEGRRAFVLSKMAIALRGDEKRAASIEVWDRSSGKFVRIDKLQLPVIADTGTDDANWQTPLHARHRTHADMEAERDSLFSDGDPSAEVLGELFTRSVVIKLENGCTMPG